MLYILLALIVLVAILTVVPQCIRRYRAGYRILPRRLDKGRDDPTVGPYDPKDDPRLTGAKLAPPDMHDVEHRAKTGF